VIVNQIPGGEVTSVMVERCNGDAAVVRSIENAVYSASPLPPPPVQALFERVVRVTFRPED
jgi:TonB family protein